MAAAWDPASYNLDCYLYENGVKGDWLGGADSLANAIAVASAAFIAMQGASPRSRLGVAVLNSTGVSQAWIGRAP